MGWITISSSRYLTAFPYLDARLALQNSSECLHDPVSGEWKFTQTAVPGLSFADAAFHAPKFEP
jgi:hypothetical protein